MSQSIRPWLSTVGALTVAWSAWAAPTDAAEPIAKPTADAAHMETFAQPGGDIYFALSLTPPVARPAVVPHDVVVLFDTSASQAGEYRAKAHRALSALLAGLEPQDRVALLAVDLSAVRLTRSFVAAGGKEMQQALAELQHRVPLGSTDMSTALQTAAAVCNEQVDAGRERSVVYLGDGVSAAGLMGAAGMRTIVDVLVDSRISVSSYAVGPRVDAKLLGALANQTGGMLAVDFPEMTGAQAGAYVAEAARQPVAWPGQADLPEAIREVYPQRIPPLRFDRDTVVLGKLASKAAGPLTIDVQAEVNGKVQRLDWQVEPSAPSDEHAYLARLVDGAAADGGISLATVGSAGLDELRRMASVEARNYSRLSQHALATGELDRAQQLAGAAERLDPLNAEAATVGQAVANARRRSANMAPLELRLAKRQAAEGPADAGADDPEGALLDAVEKQERVYVQFLRSEVQNAISHARGMMGVDPESAASQLKLILEKVRQAAELDPEVRSQLTDKIEDALQTASQQSLVKAERELRQEGIIAERQAQQQILRDLFLQEQKVDQLMSRFNALMDEERYRDAEAVADIAEEMAPGTAGLRTAELSARMTGYTADMDAVRDARHKGVIDSTYQIELALVPQPDEPPILYPDPEVWQLLTERRKKYAAVDLTESNPSEAKIIAALDDKTELEFVDQPLSDVVEYLRERHEVEIQLDNKALADAGLGSDTPVTRNIKGITLRSALRLMLGEMDLTYVIRDEVLMITSKTEAENMLSTKVYPVGDLVIPVPGARGMGGGGGGMGGGFFAVQDLKLGKKSKQPQAAEQAVPAQRPAKQPAVDFKAPIFGAPAAAPAIGADVNGAAVKRTVSAQPIRIEIKEGVDPEAAWNDYFVSHKAASGGDDVAPSLASVRETVRKLMQTHEYEQVIALINAALRNQQGQPWMFEALGLAMQADRRPMAEIERALMSALDFTSDPTDMMYLAQYLARSGLNARALQLFHQVAQLDPTSPEPFVQGLKLAQRLDDLDGIQWSTVGILSQAWPKQRVGIWQEGFRAAEAALERLRSEGRKAEAKQYQTELDKALVRDCVVIVSWTGDADVDLFVEEPSGTICSSRNPRTTSGGSMLGDAVSKTGQRKSEGASEVYVCPKGFDGTYRVMVRRVWGKLAANKVTVDIYWHYFSKREKKQTKQLELISDEAVAAFDLQDGRRTEPLAEQQVANAVAGQVAVGRQLLAQQLNALNNPQALGSFLSGANHSGQPDGLGFNPFNPFVPFGFKGAVGYQPVITSLPKGAIMSTSAVISADRRYVRVSPIPFFSGVSEVNTFNYVTGASGTSNGAGGGGFGSGGGGGGLGGFGGGGKGGGF